MTKRYWLMKTEPEVFSIDDLEAGGREEWDGVRNYQARNYMRNEMKVGDEVLFYHSRCDPPGVAGIAGVCAAARPDLTQFDPKSPYHDPKATRAEPRWFMVAVEFIEKFPVVVSLAEMKDDPALEGMLVTKRGQRLSIQPVEPAHFRRVRQLGRKKKRLGQ